MKIPPFKLTLEPMNDEAKELISQKCEWVNEELGTRHQIGGEPALINEGDYPKCPCCGEGMTFYAQLDAINHKICIADFGLIYVYICFDCIETTAVIQSY
jgi:hypothetical protein